MHIIDEGRLTIVDGKHADSEGKLTIDVVTGAKTCVTYYITNT